MYLALYRKYRPQRFSDVVGQRHITDTLRRQVEAGKTSHAYLFVGSRGTGKTTCAKILSRAVNCENPVEGEPCNRCPSCRGILSGAVMDVVEIDAASNNGVDNVRSIRDEAVYTPASVKKRVYIIDEVHMLSGPAFNALLKILEEPPEHLIFILATTELGKIPATILSRCQRFSFRRLGAVDIEERLRFVAREEGLDLTDGAASLLARLGDGAMRDALSLLDQCVGRGEITEEAVLSSIGLTGARAAADLWRAAASGDTPRALELFEGAYRDGTEPAPILSELLSLIRDMLIARVAPRGAERLISCALGPEELSALSEGVSVKYMLRASALLQETLGAMPTLRDQRTAAEVALIRLSSGLSGQGSPSAEAEPEKWAAPAKKPAFSPPPERKKAPEPPKPAEVRQDPPEASPKPAETAAEEVITQERSPAPAASGDWWTAVLGAPEVKNLMAYHFLASPGAFRASESGNTVTLSTSDGFALMMADTAEVRETLARAASGILGRPVTVKIAEAAETGAPDEDKLDALKIFGNVIIK